MTRFVYVLPAGRFRWEVRIDPLPRGSQPPYSVTHIDPEVVPGTTEQWFVMGTVDGNPGNGQGPAAICEYEPTAHTIAALLNADAGMEPLFYRRKAHALIAARAIAILIGGEVQPHNRRGRIQDPDSYGGDNPRRRG